MRLGKGGEMGFELKGRRGVFINVRDELGRYDLSTKEIEALEYYDLLYRTLCAILYNYVPTSGHPGGSISSGRFVEGIVFSSMDYDLSDPDREDADILSYAAGHKALGLYAMFALRNEFARVGDPSLLPKDVRYEMRLEDLLGFRRNPTADTPLFKKYKAKALDGHPTPATPFLKLSTGASGVGVASSFGLALGAMDFYGIDKAPYVHVVEGEGGMTPGRVSEAFAFAATAGLNNIVFHIDWNQASIDSNHVTRDENGPGEYVQWDPCEFAYLHDWNVILVPDGKDFREVLTAQFLAKELKNTQPTAIVYRTIKGWKYGIEGKDSHGAGHKFCSEGFYNAVREFEETTGISFERFSGEATPENIEKSYFDALLKIREAVLKEKEKAVFLAGKLKLARERLFKLARRPRNGAPRVEVVYSNDFEVERVPDELGLKAGGKTTLRGVLGDVLGYYNKRSGGAILAAAADLLGSTSTSNITKGFEGGFYHASKNPLSRTIAIGGICEDAMSGVMSGLAAYGKHIGVCASYGAFIAALGHVAMRLHGIGQQARVRTFGGNYNPFILVCGHAGLKTGEDGPTHADPQALQLLQENFPAGVMITLTPWDPQEIWPLVTAALKRRPCIIAPFVTRPTESVLDRTKYGLPPASLAAHGVYPLRRVPNGKGTLVLQESGVTYAFIEHVLPRLDREGVELNIYYVSSAELFDMLPLEEQEEIFPWRLREEAMGITGFTLPTLYKFVVSRRGRMHSLHPFMKGHYMGSGQAESVLLEAGLDPESQYEAIIRYLKG